MPLGGRAPPRLASGAKALSKPLDAIRGQFLRGEVWNEGEGGGRGLVPPHDCFAQRPCSETNRGLAAPLLFESATETNVTKNSG